MVRLRRDSVTVGWLTIPCPREPRSIFMRKDRRKHLSPAICWCLTLARVSAYSAATEFCEGPFQILILAGLLIKARPLSSGTGCYMWQANDSVKTKILNR